MSGWVLAAIAAKELRDALRNRWFLLYTAGFVAIALGLSWLGLAGSGLAGVSGYGRTSAALVNLVLLIAPLMGLSIGAQSLAGERERGTMATLLSQPVTRLELLAGKWCGLATALVAALLVGFGLPGVVMAAGGVGADADAYLGLAGLSILLGLAGLGLGTLLSCLVKTTAGATASAIGMWLALVFVGDLGLLGVGMGMRLETGQLLTVALVNPLTDFRVAAITTAGASPETLGPAGLLLFAKLGSWTVPTLAAVLAGWAAVPLAAAHALLRRGDVA